MTLQSRCLFVSITELSGINTLTLCEHFLYSVTQFFIQNTHVYLSPGILLGFVSSSKSITCNFFQVLLGWVGMFKALWSISILKDPDAGLPSPYYSLLAAFPSASIWIDTKEPFACQLFYQWSKCRSITSKWSAVISAPNYKGYALFFFNLQYIQLSCIHRTDICSVSVGIPAVQLIDLP